ncbi:Membrane protein insertase YidC [Lysinibacillus sphaericus]
MKNLKLLSMLGLAVFVLSGCKAVENKEGFFYSVFVKPMEFLLEFFGNDIFSGSYGLAIIAITVLIRLVLMPIMLKNYRQQQLMKTKMDAFKPEMEAVQKKMKEAKTKEEQMQYQQEMMALYQKHGVNPLNMGCLPMLIQMPIIMGLYFSILYSADVKSHMFLWFSLGSPDIVMTIIAGIVYLVQARVSLSDRTRATKKANEDVYLHFANYDCLYFYVFYGSTTALLVCQRCITNSSNVYWSKILFGASRKSRIINE